MGPDEGVQQVLQTLVGSLPGHGFAGAVWVRSGIFFAEARVFPRHAMSESEGVVETIKVESTNHAAAMDLLEQEIEQRFGSIKAIVWLKKEP